MLLGSLVPIGCWLGPDDNGEINICRRCYKVEYQLGMCKVMMSGLVCRGSAGTNVTWGRGPRGCQL